MKSPADLKILTVDDDEEIRSTLSMLLEFEGFQTVHAKNGRIALDYLLSTSERELPDLIFLDYMMPVMSGDHFCQMIAVDKRLKHIPVVMMTAGGNLVKLLSKPMDIYSVLSMIEYLLKPHTSFQGGLSLSGLAH